MNRNWKLTNGWVNIMLFSTTLPKKNTVSKFVYYKRGDKNMHHKTKFIIDKFGSSLVDAYD
jgi:hypothetical protein